MKALLALPLLALSAVSMGQTAISKNGYPNKIGMPRRGVSNQDARFIREAAAVNAFEVRSSQLAMNRSHSPFVKQFAKEMAIDHTAALNELKTVASKKGIRVGSALPTKLQATLNRLSGLRGSAFDAAYLKVQRGGHVETAMKMERQIRVGNDSDVKSYAIKTLPAVRMHQKMLMTKTTMMGAMKMKHGM